MAGPKAGRNAVITVASNPIGKLRGVKFNVDVKLIKDWSNDQRGPEVLEAGDETYGFSADKMWVDSVYVNAIMSQSGGVSVVVEPEGSAGMTATFGDAIFTKYQFTAARDGVSAESVEGEGKTLVIAS